MMVLVYGSDQVISRIAPLLSARGVSMLTVTKEMITQWDWRFPKDMKEICLVIVDTTEIGTEQVCSYFSSLRRTPIALLVDDREANWKEIYNYHVVAHIPINAGDREFAYRVNSCMSALMPGKTK